MTFLLDLQIEFDVSVFDFQSYFSQRDFLQWKVKFLLHRFSSPLQVNQSKIVTFITSFFVNHSLSLELRWLHIIILELDSKKSIFKLPDLIFNNQRLISEFLLVYLNTSFSKFWSCYWPLMKPGLFEPL